jgi:hypothetical protein
MIAEMNPSMKSASGGKMVVPLTLWAHANRSMITSRVHNAPMDRSEAQEEGSRRQMKSPRFGEGPWQNVTGYRDPVGEVEKPHGQWNLLELVVDHDHVKYFVNGKFVNEATDLNATKGKILFQREGAETYYRNLEIAPLK